MANIDGVSLPDGRAYDLVDNTSGYQNETLATPLTINGTQETTVEGALEGLNDYVDDIVEAAFDVCGAKNLFNIFDLKKIDSCAVANNGFVNNNTDTLSYYKCKIVAYDSNDTAISTLFSESISQTGLKEVNVTIPNNTAWIRFAHNGDYRLIYIDFVPNDVLRGLPAIMTFDVNGFDPSTNGGLDVRNIMIQDVRIPDHTFVPYAKTNQQLTKDVSGLSNENLLINPFFTINQRGFTSAVASTIPLGFTVDMWKLFYESSGGAGVLSKVTNGLHFQPVGGTNDNLRLVQTPSDPTIFNGKTLTFTICYAKGNSSTFEYLSGTLVNFDASVGGLFVSGADNGYITAQYVPAYTSWFIVVLQECTIKAVKLELGTVSTLANDIEPDYATENLKCQRYFKRIGGGDIGIGIATATTLFDVFIPTGVPMRTSTPTVTYVGTISLQDTTGTITGILSAEKATNPNTKIRFNATGLTVGSVSRVAISNDGYIDLTAN